MESRRWRIKETHAYHRINEILPPDETRRDALVIYEHCRQMPVTRVHPNKAIDSCSRSRQYSRRLLTAPSAVWKTTVATCYRSFPLYFHSTAMPLINERLIYRRANYLNLETALMWKRRRSRLYIIPRITRQCEISLKQESASSLIGSYNRMTLTKIKVYCRRIRISRSIFFV